MCPDPARSLLSQCCLFGWLYHCFFSPLPPPSHARGAVLKLRLTVAFAFSENMFQNISTSVRLSGIHKRPFALTA